MGETLPPSRRSIIPPPPRTPTIYPAALDDEFLEIPRATEDLGGSEPPASSPRSWPTATDSSPPSSRRSSLPARSSSLPPSRKSIPPLAFAIAAATFAPACAVATTSDPPPSFVEEGTPLRLSQLHVTCGTLSQPAPGHLEATAPKVRAVAPSAGGDGAELRFTYRGPTDTVEPLADGELRHQIGLKMRAESGCNLVYVMWRIEPESELVVSVKSNPGARNDECGATGYTNITPEWSAPLPKLALGDHHTLAATIEDGRMLVKVDGRTAWEGALGDAAMAMHGPVGLRTDNAKFDMELVPIGRASLHDHPPLPGTWISGRPKPRI